MGLTGEITDRAKTLIGPVAKYCEQHHDPMDDHKCDTCGIESDVSNDSPHVVIIA